MAKTITIPYGEKEYTLEYTRATVAQMERNGFVIENVKHMPVNLIPKLFAGAFLAHHPAVQAKTAEEIYSKLGNKEDLIARLGEMYTEPVNALIDEPDPTEKITWGANWES